MVVEFGGCFTCPNGPMGPSGGLGVPGQTSTVQMAYLFNVLIILSTY